MKDFILYHFCLLGPPSTIPFIWTFNPVIFFWSKEVAEPLWGKGAHVWNVLICSQTHDHWTTGPSRKGSCLNHLGELYIPLLSSRFFSLWGIFSSVLTEPLKEICYNLPMYSVQFSSVTQCVRLFATPWTAVCQASLSITNSNSCPLSWWCHPTRSSSVVPFSSCLHSFPASGSLQMSQFFTSGGQSIGVSTSASVLPMNIQDWSPLG